MTDNFYDLLDVPPDATQEEIKAAFREQVRIYHPDRNDDSRARAQFTAIKTAYDILSNPVERRAYDRMGHLDYVAKRTSGIPSPDRWATDEEEETDVDDESGGTSSVSTKRASWSDVSDRGASSRVSTSSAASTDGSGYAGGTATAGANASASTTETPYTRGGTANERRSRAGASTSSSQTGRSTVGSVDRRHPIARWWRRRHVALPLLLIATGTYVLGLASYLAENAEAFTTLVGDVVDAGGDVGAITTALTADGAGAVSGFDHVSTTVLVSAPIDQWAWIGVLVGVIGLAIATIVIGRHRYRSSLRGALNTDETIVLAAAIGGVGMAISGPLLAGTLMLPLLYGVVIYRSRRLPGWSPTYVWVLFVTAPIVGLLAGWANASTVSLELVAFVLLPVCGAVGFPIRFFVRRRLGV